MSLDTDSPAHSSSSDDFAAFLDGELDYTSDRSLDQEGEDGDDDYDTDIQRIKRQKVEVSGSIRDPDGSTSNCHAEQSLIDAVSIKKDICAHPGFVKGLCMMCGKKVDDDTAASIYGSAVPLSYIHRDMRLGNDEIARLRDGDLKNLLRQKKLYLVLDLDHTLLNSTRLQDIKPDEEYLMNQIDSLQDVSKGKLFRLDFMRMMTKLRPFVRTFLEEANTMFEMYIYTMGERAYANEMARLLDPRKVYFSSRVIAQDDCTQRHQKGLDVVLGQESAVLILDDTEIVWRKHKENLILMERYHFFASSCQQFGYNCKSLSELNSDENESDGALASVLKVLKQIHMKFFDLEPGANRDVREVLKMVRKEVLKGCKVVFSRVFPNQFPAENHHLWKMAEQLGAICSTEVDSLVTHVIANDTGTEKARWAVKEKKFLVNLKWLEAANFFWRKQPEENFPVNQTKD